MCLDREAHEEDMLREAAPAARRHSPYRQPPTTNDPSMLFQINYWTGFLCTFKTKILPYCLYGLFIPSSFEPDPNRT